MQVQQLARSFDTDFANNVCFLKGRVQFATMNTAVEELNNALEDKYIFMARTFANMTSRLLDYKIVEEMKGVIPPKMPFLELILGQVSLCKS